MIGGRCGGVWVGGGVVWWDGWGAGGECGHGMLWQWVRCCGRARRQGGMMLASRMLSDGRGHGCALGGCLWVGRLVWAAEDGGWVGKGE